MHFGGRFGPHTWEVLGFARSEIAEFLYEHTNYHIKYNNNVLALLIIKTDDKQTPKMIEAPINKYNPSFKLPDGCLKIKFPMYVDDLLSATL